MATRINVRYGFRDRCARFVSQRSVRVKSNASAITAISRYVPTHYSKRRFSAFVIDRPMKSGCLLKIRHDLFREKCRFEASRHNAGDRLTGAGYCRILSLPAIATHDFSTQHLVPTQPVLTSTLRVAAYRWCTPLQPVLLIKIII